MMNRAWRLNALILLLLSGMSVLHGQPRTRLGSDVLLADSLHLIQNKRVGLLCNHTSRLGDGTFLFDALQRQSDVDVAAVFTPEHGFHGTSDAGAHVTSGMIDGIPLHSLFGNTRRPSKKMLSDIDVLVVDLQDIGSRYYTYVSTMAYCLEEAARAGIPVVVLDRPNPLGGKNIEGVIRENRLRSFVGLLPIPVRHGMTIGELARMMRGEKWLHGAGDLLLHVIPMQGWRREMHHDDTGLPWTNPSPNIVSLEAAFAYAGTCLLEGSNLSEGRGTEAPFLQFGAPFIDGMQAAEALRSLGLAGVEFESVHFTPTPRKGATKPRFNGQRCGGVRLRIVNANTVQPWRCGIEILYMLTRLYGEKVRFTSYLDTLAGIGSVWTATRDTLLRRERDEVAAFSRQRAPYLLYR